MMTIQMILCNIEDRGYLWCKLIDCFKLETADFCHSYRIRFHFQCFGSIWSSDISYYKYRLTCILHNFSKECCGCCLTVCTCDCKYFSVSDSVCQLYFSPHRKSLLIETLYDWQICRYSGT